MTTNRNACATLQTQGRDYQNIEILCWMFSDEHKPPYFRTPHCFKHQSVPICWFLHLAVIYWNFGSRLKSWKSLDGEKWNSFYIWHWVPNILLWSILCKTVGLPSSTGESERTARRQFHSPTLRCFRGRLCEVAAGRGPLKQSRWPESNWTLPLRSVGVAPSLGRFWLVFTALKLRYVLRRHIILSDSDGNQGVLDCFTVYPGLGGSAK